MDKQLHISGSETLKEEIKSVQNGWIASIHKPIPGTGFWTSTWRPDTSDSSWLEWCLSEDFGAAQEKHLYLLTPAPSSRIRVIDNMTDLVAVLLDYPSNPQPWTKAFLQKELQNFLMRRLSYEFDVRSLEVDIDFVALSKDYDALHVTEGAAWSLHLTMPLHLSGWDCESTIWFRWCFTQIEQITPKRGQKYGTI